MLPPRWSHPACMNMEVNSVRKSAAGLARKRLGTKAHLLMKASPPLSSTRKKSTFAAIKMYVTIGAVLRLLLSSPIGNIMFSFLNTNTANLIASFLDALRVSLDVQRLDRYTLSTVDGAQFHLPRLLV